MQHKSSIFNKLSILLYSYYTDLVFLAVLYKWSAIGIWVTVCENVSDNAVVHLF